MILYKYLRPARVDVLKHRRIRFTQPGDFNDPFEFRPKIRELASDAKLQEDVEEHAVAADRSDVHPRARAAGSRRLPGEQSTDFQALPGCRGWNLCRRHPVPCTSDRGRA